MKKLNIFGNNAKVTMGDNSPIIEVKSEKGYAEVFFDKHLLISIVIALMLGLVIGLSLNSFTYAMLSSVISFGIVMFLNPNRRFFRLGVSIILYAITYLTISSVNMELKGSYGGYVNGFLHFSKEFSMVAFLLLLVVGIVCIVLDYLIFQKKTKIEGYR